MRIHALRTVATMVCLASSIIVASPATTNEWRRDLDAIVRDVLAIHPRPFAKIGEIVWRREAASLRSDLPRLSEPARVVRLMQLIGMIGDGHTLIELEAGRYALWYPLRLYQFSDGYFVTSAHASVRELAGAEVLTLAGRPAEEVIDAARSLMGADNEFDAMERLYAVHNAYLMQGLGYAGPDGSLDATFRLRDGSIVRRRLTPHPAEEGSYPPGVPVFEWHFRSEVYGMPFGTPDDWIAAFGTLPSGAFEKLDEGRPPHLQQRTRYTRRALPESDAYYLQFNQTDDSGMAGYMSEALQEVDELKPKRLIIDIRLNFGGDGSTVEPMIRQFIRRDTNKPWKELYLITGRKTFSAAMAIIDAFIDHTDVTLVGEPAGAPPSFSGDTVSRPYPALGLTLEVSALTHLLTDSADLRPFVPVDVPAPISFADYVAGKDPAVDPILAGEEMRSIPTILRADGGAAARRVYERRKARYGNLEWFVPPEELAIRVAAADLLEKERFEEAIEGAKLNSEIHPFVWNTWYNLGIAVQKAGRVREALPDYQCVVLLEPTNWNVPALRKLFTKLNADPEPAPGCPVRN